MDIKSNETALVDKPSSMDDSPIFEDLLLKLKTVTLSQLNEAKASAKEQNKPISKVLVQKNWLSSNEVEALSVLHPKYEKKCQEEHLSRPIEKDDRRQGDRRRQGRRSSDQSASIGEPLERIFRASNALAKYQIIEEISRGGMGIVYKAKDLDLQRIVAIKIIRDVQESNHSQVLRFQKEAEVLARLQHPNIVPIYDTGNSEGVKFLVMKYIDGVTLEEYIHNEKFPLTPKIVIELMSKIAKAVYYMHQHRILHRDLKPSNVMIDRLGEPHIMDFGLAKSLAENEKNITRCGITMGTPSYISPEQALGDNANLTEKTDIYALGGILYEALTLHPPFQGKNILYVLNQVVYEEVKPPRFYNAHINPDIEAICLKALAKKPSDRYINALAFAEDLERLTKGQTICAKKNIKGWKYYFAIWKSSLLALLFLFCIYWITSPTENQGEELLFSGFEHFLTGNFELALNYSEQALKISPKNPRGYLLRSKIFQIHGQTEQALENIKSYLQLYPQSQTGIHLLKQLEQEQNTPLRPSKSK